MHNSVLKIPELRFLSSGRHPYVNEFCSYVNDLCSYVNEFFLYRYTINSLLIKKKYRVSVSVSAILVSSIDDTQNKVSVSVIMVSSHL